jgi:hypothetical protein
MKPATTWVFGTGTDAVCGEAEIAETVLVAAALRAGAAVTHGAHCLE